MVVMEERRVDLGGFWMLDRGIRFGLISESGEGFAFRSTSDDPFVHLIVRSKVTSCKEREFHLDLLPMFFLCNGLRGVMRSIAKFFVFGQLVAMQAWYMNCMKASCTVMH